MNNIFKNQTTGKNPSIQGFQSITHLYVSLEMHVVGFEPEMHLLLVNFLLLDYCQLSY